MTVNDAMYKVYGIIRRGGPVVTEYANLSKAFEIIEASPYDPGIVEWVVQQIEGRDRDREFFNIIPHIFRRPYGYAGDFSLLSKMYKMNDLVTHGLQQDVGLSKWDQYVASLPSTQSVFNREEYLLKLIGDKIEKDGAWRVLDIACGDGRFLRKLRKKYPHIFTVGIDNEPMAIARATGLSEVGQKNERYELMNAVSALPAYSFDVVVSAGLCDYLPDALMKRLLERVRREYDPDLMVFGNLTVHPCVPLMNLLGWKLVYRHDRHLEMFIEDHKEFHDYIYIIGEEPLGINLFLEIEKQ